MSARALRFWVYTWFFTLFAYSKFFGWDSRLQRFGAGLCGFAFLVRFWLRPARGPMLWIWGSCQVLLALFLVRLATGAGPVTWFFTPVVPGLLGLPGLVISWRAPSVPADEDEPHLARWTFTPEQWRAHWTRCARRARSGGLSARAWFSCGMLALVCGATAAHFGLGAYAIFLAASAGAAVGLLNELYFHLLGGAKEERMIQASSTVHIGETFARIGDESLRWGPGSPMRLVEARLRPGFPASLRLVFHVEATRGPSERRTFEVPVPPGREGEARGIARRLLKRSATG